MILRRLRRFADAADDAADTAMPFSLLRRLITPLYAIL